MIKNHHKILAGVLIAQIILSIIVFWPRPSTAGQREPLFPAIEVEDVASLRIEDGEGNLVEMQQVGGEWVLPNLGQFPVTGEAVTSLLEKLTDLTTGRLVASSSVSHKRLGVATDDFSRRVSFETGEGRGETVYIGTSPQYGSMHFRLDGQDETYLTSQLTIWDVKTEMSGWIDTGYRSAAQADVTKMALENQNGTFVFEREGEEDWRMIEPSPPNEGETLDQVQVNDVLRRAASQTIRRPLGKAEQEGYGMDAPHAVVTLEMENKTATVRVGALDTDDESYVVKSSESEYYVRVGARSVAPLVENGRDSFIQEATPEPESDES